MGSEEAQQLLAQVQLRCLVLEADKEAEGLRAVKYRNILDTLAGANSSNATQPEAACVIRAARGALAPPALPAASSSSDPEVTVVAVSRRPSIDPAIVGRKRNPSSTETPTRGSKRTRFSSNVPQSTPSKPCDARTVVPRNRFKFGMDMERIFERGGVRPLVLTRAEAARAEGTPSIDWTMFLKIFGGSLSEWPQCFKVPGYEDFVCTSITAQPFMPIVTGKPGLLLQPPAVIEHWQSDHDKITFHVFSTTQQAGRLHYRGRYKKVPLPQIPFTWSRLPPDSHDRWVKRVSLGKSDTMRAIRARIQFRNKIKREPLALEVQAYMQDQFVDQVTHKEVSVAFRSGKEKLAVHGIECMEYDSHLAAMIQRSVQDQDDNA